MSLINNVRLSEDADETSTYISRVLILHQTEESKIDVEDFQHYPKGFKVSLGYN